MGRSGEIRLRLRWATSIGAAALVVALAATTLLTRSVPDWLSRPVGAGSGIVSAATVFGYSTTGAQATWLLGLALVTLALVALPAAAGLVPPPPPVTGRGHGRLLAWGLAAACLVMALNARNEVALKALDAPLTDAFHEGEYLAFAPVFATSSRPFEASYFIHGYGMNAFPGWLGRAVSEPGAGIAVARLARAFFLAVTWLATFLVVATGLRAVVSEARWAWAFLAAASLLLLFEGVLFRVTGRPAVLLLLLLLLARALQEPPARARFAHLRFALAGLLVPLGLLYNYSESLSAVPVAAVALALALASGTRHGLLATLAFWSGLALAAVGLFAVAGASPFLAAWEQIGYWARNGATIWASPLQETRAWVLLWLVISLQGAALAWLWHAWRREGDGALRRLGPLAPVLVAGLLECRAQLVRADHDHLLWASFFTMVLASIAAAAALSSLQRRRGTVLLILVGLAVVARFDRVNPVRALQAMGRAWRAPHTPDAGLVPPTYQQAVEAVAPAVGAGCFFTMTSEGLWYYLLQRPACSRFHHATYARTPEAQAEVVSALEAARPPVVLLANEFWTQRLDGIPTMAATPLVFAHLFQRYRPFVRVGGHEFWRRGEPEFLEEVLETAAPPRLLAPPGAARQLRGRVPLPARGRPVSVCVVAEARLEILACASQLETSAGWTDWRVDLPFVLGERWQGDLSVRLWLDRSEGFRRLGPPFRFGDL